MRIWQKLLPIVLLPASLLCVGPVSADEADRLFTQGATAFEAGKTEEALKNFREAWALRKSYDLASAMAQAELLLGRHRDAAEHLSYALRNFAITAKPEKRAPLEKALAEVRTKIVALRIKATIDGAEVRLNGHALGKTPLEQEVFAEPGAITVELRAEGHDDARQTLDAKAGTTQDVTLAPAPKTRSMVPAVILGGVSVVGLGVGAGLAIASTDQGTEALKLRDAYIAKHGAKPCSDVAGATTDCNAIGDRLRAQDALGNASIGVFVGSGVVAAGAVGYWLWARRNPARAQVRAWPAIGATGAGMIIEGRF
jgi:tetratricopeptide (TPR) repeat protein